MKRPLLLYFLTLLLAFPGLTQIQVGETAPDFTVTDVEGISHTLSDYTGAGQFVMLDFFFTTCGPCQYYTPQISLAYETYGCNQGDLVVLGIDYGDTDEEVILYDETYGSIYPSASGLEGGGNAVVAAYGIVGFPFVCLIDTNSIVVEIFDIPTMQVFNYFFPLYGIEQMDCTTGMQDPLHSDEVSIHPNPASSVAIIQALAGSTVTIFRSDGSRMVEFQTDTDRFPLEVTGWENGLYFVRTASGNRQGVLKLGILH